MTRSLSSVRLGQPAFPLRLTDRLESAFVGRVLKIYWLVVVCIAEHSATAISAIFVGELGIVVL